MTFIYFPHVPVCPPLLPGSSSSARNRLNNTGSCSRVVNRLNGSGKKNINSEREKMGSNSRYAGSGPSEQAEEEENLSIDRGN